MSDESHHEHPGPEGRSDDPGWARRNSMRIVLVAIVIGALVAGGVALSMNAFDDRGSVGGTDIGESERLAENAFTQSSSGDCLTWPEGDPGDPAKVVCTDEHRFEVAGALDTAVLPGSEFGDSAAWPGAQRFAEIRDEQCPVIVDAYLQGKLDPQGRFSVGMMFPSEQQWGKGARELRCGLQVTGKDGTPQLFSGKVADQDQSFQWPAGTCIGIDPQTRRVATPPTAVNCSEPHAFQTTGIVDLAPRFGDQTSGRPWPGEKEQNAYLTTICPGQAERFVGGKKKLEDTTLNVQWSVISEPRWLAGSRKVVCYLGLPDRGGFATLVGDARATVLINGKLPVAPSQAPPGRALPTPVPLPPGVEPNSQEAPAPAG
ncbi:septum formation family protein [Gordonia desulfuricans]|uniref:Septum formation family protein n=1 Tax=Gordonia desulfuricans TaxID=89051 RepID=A0A7K3LUT2_9ACTN|nr:septum formation family protein [Gordonia desulfuricans]NDK92050.1 septum formation family protein [Gordonia desulfuricans]